MRIRMLTTQRGAEDGVTVRTYEAGQEYDLSHSAGQRDLASVFVRENWAEPVAAPPAVEETSGTAAPPSPAPSQASPAANQQRQGRRR